MMPAKDNRQEGLDVYSENMQTEPIPHLELSIKLSS
jgi:hypothetical protein